MPELYEQIVAALAEGEPFALGIISDIKGSSPQKKGAKALFFADGRIVGTLGGGCLEAEIQDRARRALKSGIPATFDLVLDHDFGWDDGLICGGKVCGLIIPNAQEAAPVWQELARRKSTRTWMVTTGYKIAWHEDETADCLYQETVTPPCPLWIAGSGHVAQAVAPIATQLDFEVTVFDDRPTFASHKFFPERTAFRVGAWEQILQEQFPERPVFGLVVTRGHQRDALVLARWLQQPFAFLGMIGSRRKARIIFEQFAEDRIATPEQISRVACPVGLDIDSRTVPEIAVSIAAQLVQERAAVLRGSQANDSRSAEPPSIVKAVSLKP